MSTRGLLITEKRGRLKQFTKSNSIFLTKGSLFISGFILGFSIAVGLGVTAWWSIVFGSVVGVGVLISGSFVGYLVIQTLALFIVTVITYVFFQVSTSALVPVNVVQLTYLTAVLVAPLMFLFPKLRNVSNRFTSAASSSLISSLLFAVLVLVLRDRMPADATFALSRLYYFEDNAGIVAGVSKALSDGYSPQSAFLGEFTTGIYIAASALIALLGQQNELGLLPALTHWNMTLLFLAWLPLSALASLGISGKKFTSNQLTAFVIGITGILGVLLWPFLANGHTSVILVALFAMPLLALTLNKKLALSHPVFFAVLAIALGFIVGNIWFPLMPFVAAVILLVFLSLLQVQFLEGNKKVVIALLGVFLIIAISMMPYVLELVLANNSLLQLTGATRAPTQFLILLWLALVAISFIIMPLRGKPQKLLVSHLFFFTIGTLLLSSLFLLATGTISNAGSFGYGANKYLLTSISFSLPILWLVIIYLRGKVQILTVAGSGLALIFALFIAQPDQQQILNSGVINIGPVNVEDSKTGVFVALQQALDGKPDHVLCVSDSGRPGTEVRWESYFCTRWGESLAGADSPEGWTWRTVMINQLPEENLNIVRDSLADREVVIIRFADSENLADQESGELPLWWEQYVSSSWKVIKVP